MADGWMDAQICLTTDVTNQCVMPPEAESHCGQKAYFY